MTIIIIFSTLLFAAIAAADDAVYMSKLMKALTPTPSGWSNNTHFCKWNGVVCRQSSNRVNSITLPSSSLTGTLPSDLNTLTKLTSIDLHNNSLTGPIPSLSNLNALQTVLFGHNNFTSIPDNCFSGITPLKTLNLSNNLNLVHWLFPTDLSLSTSLQTLDLQATNIIGTLPSDMFDWFPNLETLILSHNNFTGSLPLSLGRSSIMGIQVISSMKFLSQAFLTCPIQFTCLISNFDHNNILSGVVPPSLMALSSLKNVSLDNNLLQGSITLFRKGVSST